MTIDIIAGYIFFLFVLSCWNYHKFRKQWHYRQIVHYYQWNFSKVMLPMVGLDLTDGEEVPDNELNEEQLMFKETANEYGFKVKKL